MASTDFCQEDKSSYPHNEEAMAVNAVFENSSSSASLQNVASRNGSSLYCNSLLFTSLSQTVDELSSKGLVDDSFRKNILVHFAKYADRYLLEASSAVDAIHHLNLDVHDDLYESSNSSNVLQQQQQQQQPLQSTTTICTSSNITSSSPPCLTTGNEEAKLINTTISGDNKNQTIDKQKIVNENDASHHELLDSKTPLSSPFQTYQAKIQHLKSFLGRKSQAKCLQLLGTIKQYKNYNHRWGMELHDVYFEVKQHYTSRRSNSTNGDKTKVKTYQQHGDTNGQQLEPSSRVVQAVLKLENDMTDHHHESSNNEKTVVEDLLQNIKAGHYRSNTISGVVVSSSTSQNTESLPILKRQSEALKTPLVQERFHVDSLTLLVDDVRCDVPRHLAQTLEESRRNAEESVRNARASRALKIPRPTENDKNEQYL
eukprot:g1829.t1